MRFHQNFILSLLFFVLLFAALELKNVLLFQSTQWWVVNETAMGSVYNSDLYPDIILSKIDSWPSWLITLTKFALVLIASLLVTRTSIKNLVFEERSYYPILLFPSLTIGLFSSVGSIKMLIVIILQVWLFSLLFRGFKRSSSIAEFFYAGLLTTISTLIYPQSIVSVATLLISVALLNRGAREFFCTIVGLIIPLFIYSYLNWISGSPFMAIANELWRSLTTPSTQNIAQWVDTSNRLGISILTLSAAPLVVASLVAISSLRNTLRYARRRQRKFLNLMVFQLLVVTLISLLLPSSAPQTIVMNCVPLSIILSHYFLQNNNRFSKWIFWLIPIGMVIYNFVLICEMY